MTKGDHLDGGAQAAPRLGGAVKVPSSVDDVESPVPVGPGLVS